jgi:hypothetical protein
MMMKGTEVKLPVGQKKHSRLQHKRQDKTLWLNQGNQEQELTSGIKSCATKAQ